MADLSIINVKNAIITALQDITDNISVYNGFPWSPGRDNEFPAFYILPPTLRLDQTTISDNNRWIAEYVIYYAICMAFGEEVPEDNLIDVQESVMNYFASRETDQQLRKSCGASIYDIVSTVENDFTQWARTLSKPYAAVEFRFICYIESAE